MRRTCEGMRTPAQNPSRPLVAQLFQGQAGLHDDLCRELEESGLFTYEVTPPERKQGASTGRSTGGAPASTQSTIAVGRNGSAYLAARVNSQTGPCVAFEQLAGPQGLRCSGTFDGHFAWRDPLCALAHTAEPDIYVGLSEASGPNARFFKLLLGVPGTRFPNCRLRGVEVARGPLAGPVLSAVDEDDGQAWLLEQASRRLHCLPFKKGILFPMETAWAAGHEPVALCVLNGRLLALTLHAGAPADGGSSGVPTRHLGVLEMQSSAWRLIQGSSISIPQPHQDSDVVAAPSLQSSPQSGESLWLVLLQPRQEAGAQACAAVLLYSLAAGTWQGPAPATPSSGKGRLAISPSRLAASNKSVWRDLFTEEAAAGSGWFAVAQVAREGLAAAVKLGASPSCSYFPAPSEEEEEEEAVALARAMDSQGNLVTVWKEWALLAPHRLGEVAAPSSLPYNLRQAQAARKALCAAPGSAATAAVQHSPSSMWLRLVADPSLPAIRCPLRAAQQANELQRVWELLEESGAFGGGVEAGPSAALPGIAAEEHEALQQLVACLAGETHAGLLEATQLLDVLRLADLLDAPALLAETLGVLEQLRPDREMFAPLLALAEARQHHPRLQRVKVLYRHALHLHVLLGRGAWLQWALHGLVAGVDTIHEVCLCVADQLRSELECSREIFYLGSPAVDLATLASPEWQAAARSEPGRAHQLAAAFVVFLESLLEAAGGQGPPAKRRASSAASRSSEPQPGAFASAAVRPRADPAAVEQQPYEVLVPRLQRLLSRAQRELALNQALRREQAVAAAFRAAEARARRHTR